MGFLEGKQMIGESKITPSLNFGPENIRRRRGRRKTKTGMFMKEQKKKAFCIGKNK